MKKTMLKYIAAIVLIIALVAISVIKTNVSANRHERDIDKIKEDYFTTRDSLYLKQLDDSTRFYIDSILKLENHYTEVIDSLNLYHDSIQQALNMEKEILEYSDSIAPEMKAAEVSEPTIDPIVDSVLTSYRKRIEMLPKDLTKYEHRISLYEITINLSREFKISPDSVKIIVKSAG
jgi:hypothetical protein